MGVTQNNSMEVPEVLAGKYRIESKLGSGGFSHVYLGVHEDLERSVAIKVLTLDPEETDSTWLTRFQREAKVISRLHHPHTVTIYDFGQETPELFYIVMEHVDGITLHKRVRKQGPLSPELTIRLICQTLGSLEEAHQHGVLHRDIKPGNLMITRDFQDREIVKVLDFGLAKQIDLDDREVQKLDDHTAALTEEHLLLCTPRYASPEQFSRDTLTPASDIYSLGLVMWEMLVGRPAIPSRDATTCIKAHFNPEPWQLPQDVDLPVGLREILHRALDKERSERFQSCLEMLEALESLSRGDGASTDVRVREQARGQAALEGTDAAGEAMPDSDIFFPASRPIIDPNLDPSFGEIEEHTRSSRPTPRENRRPQRPAQPQTRFPSRSNSGGGLSSSSDIESAPISRDIASGVGSEPVSSDARAPSLDELEGLDSGNYIESAPPSSQALGARSAGRQRSPRQRDASDGPSQLGADPSSPSQGSPHHSSDSLELVDTGPQTGQDTSPSGAHGPPSSQVASRGDASGDAQRKQTIILAAGLGILIALVGAGVLYTVLRPAPGASDDADAAASKADTSEQAASASANGAASADEDGATYSTQGILRAIDAAGWQLESRSDSMVTDGRRHRNLRFKQGEAVLDVVLYEMKTASDASEFLREDDSSVPEVRFSNKVVQIYATRNTDRQSAIELARFLEKYREMVREE
jgi:serine/threonine protein kinase